jgi:hypothetical protein
MNQSLQSPERIVRDIYDALRALLPQPLLAKLAFKEPDYLAKGGSKIHRGRILQQRTKNVFDATWCFYEVGVGDYAAGGGAGGIGFVCFPANKKCGNGIHTTIVSDLITRYAATHPGFNASKRGSPSQCVFTYYPAMQPVDKPAVDLADLVVATFPQLEMLTVVK